MSYVELSELFPHAYDEYKFSKNAFGSDKIALRFLSVGVMGFKVIRDN